MKNRRNYYRLLCVQPDAPPAVIRSSYAALMLKLKHHPDLGGDPETAALLNEAYAVLSDPAQRADYDRWLQASQPASRIGNVAFERQAHEAAVVPAPVPTSTPAPRAQPTVERDVAYRAAEVRCSFCDIVHPSQPLPGERCVRCHSPLMSPMQVSEWGTDQRALPRFAHGGEITLVTQRTGRRARATIQDLSPLGICVLAVDPLAIDQVAKIDGALLSAVARVVSCRQAGPSAPGRAIIGLKFLTLDFPDGRGTFVSART
jgi:hypothetical protein